MNKIFLLSLIGLVLFACNDPSTLGLEVQPASDNIIISNVDFDKFDVQTQSEDSLRSDEAINLVLGELNDPYFGMNRGAFYTQILLKENNIDLGTNPIVDSVVLSYSYSGYYGDFDAGFTNIEVNQIFESIYKDSVYYSNSFQVGTGNMNNVDAFSFSNDIEDPFLRIKLKNEFGQNILDLSPNLLIDNETFLQEFNGISVLANGNTMLYLNPEGSNSHLKIFYHNDESNLDTLVLDFELGGDAARINLFNEKDNNIIIDDDSRICVQSMAGYKVKVDINNVDSIKTFLDGRVLNKVIMIFDVEDYSQLEYTAHDKLALVRVNDQEDNVFLDDFIIDGDQHFGGILENDKYEFNITRYFHKLLTNSSYTNELYLLPAGAVVNANRTILKNEVRLQIYFSEL